MSIFKAAKRKRVDDKPCDAVSNGRPAKQLKGASLEDTGVVRHALLSQYYPGLQTLRAYILVQLPSSSRLRRKKITSLGKPGDATFMEAEVQLSRLLDSTLVGHCGTPRAPAEPLQDDGRWEKWLEFSQKGDESYVTLSDGASEAYGLQSEVGYPLSRLRLGT